MTIWVNHKAYKDWAEYYAHNPHKPTTKVTQPIIKTTIKPTSITLIKPPKYLSSIPSKTKPVTTATPTNVLQRLLGGVTGNLAGLVNRIIALEHKISHLNVGKILLDIKQLGQDIIDVKNKVAYYATHLGQLKTLLLDRINSLEKRIYGDVTHDIHVVEGDISKVGADIRAEIRKGETALNTLIHKVSLYAEKVYTTARKDINGVERRLKLLWEKDKKYIIEYFKLYLEAIFPVLLIKHVLSDKFLKVFAWWIFHIIEMILFEL